ncbi:hypothetical protein PV797_06855 [Clostridiaceae bacterium M8S5]|nr:hypothetical protein PV797_06855 [Clostridiaceae bacterium M8S5]
MKILTIVVVVVAIYIFIVVRNKARNKKALKEIQFRFGKKVQRKKYSCKEIEYYWKERTKNINDDEKIDDITWNDLDMDNVFMRMNDCNSYVGEQILYSRLHCIPKGDSSTKIFEDKMAFFSSKIEERSKIQLLLNSLGKYKDNYNLPIFLANLNLNRILNIWKYKMLQVLLILSIIFPIVMQDTKYFLITSMVFALNVMVYCLSKAKYELNLDMLEHVVAIVNVANKISNNKEFSYESTFGDLKKKTIPFKKITKMLAFIKFKKDASISGDVFALLYDYIIGATMWDIVAYNNIIDLLENKREEFMELFEALGEIDATISVASFRKSLPFFCRPTYVKKHELNMEKLYHPLIDEPVCNTVNIKNSSIITGSNASGKSTYIKAVSINIILGQNINTCMAEKISFPRAYVITSMAVRDDLMAGDSYFIKEIKYLKRIVERANQGRFMVCVIDEILRGTNTEERIASSASVMSFLKSKNCIAIVASHDFELTQILAGQYDNYHFTEKINSNDIVFDYKIHEGASNSKNAIKLLKYVGFPDKIIKEAQTFNYNEINISRDRLAKG